YVLVLGPPLTDGHEVPATKSSPHRALNPKSATALAKAFRDAREAAGITQEQLAARSHISVQMVRRLEAGTSNPTLATLAPIAEQLGVSVAELLTRASI